jgi:2,3-bisphosphoglycerate-independent phosphoglycerate mutase
MSDTPKPVMLVILDGWGYREETADNAIAQARTPNFDRLWAECPHALLRTSGRDVGLPDGQMGNSEVGHMNIGAGRVVMQDLPRIDTAIEDGSLATLPPLVELVAKLRAGGGACHLLGLLSPGGVHSHQRHALALARVLDAAGVPVWLHAWTDGRDCAPLSGAGIVREVQAALPASARISTICGRYYAMDRDHRWERVGKAYAAMVDAQGPRFADAASVVDDAHNRDVTDEFIVPAVVGDFAGMRDGDALLCFNFRADRVREILAALLDPGFDGFVRGRVPQLCGAVGMARYSDALAGSMGVLFPPQPMGELLGEVVAAAGRTQLRMAETEKFPHVTYFLNGGREAEFAGEARTMVASPKVATYDLQPEMSAPELCARAVAAIEAGAHDLIVLNFANPDMVGHTGSLAAAIVAVETVDGALCEIVSALGRVGGAALVIADHGNCELMRDPETGGPHTAHTTNPVPAVLVGRAGASLHDGRLADVAPTLLSLLGITQPAAMTGRDLAA